jgi:hypothetical protein
VDGVVFLVCQKDQPLIGRVGHQLGELIGGTAAE